MTLATAPAPASRRTLRREIGAGRSLVNRTCSFDGKPAVTRDGIQLRTLAGAVVGETGFGPAVVRRLTLHALHRIEREQPESLAALHRGIMNLQADRLRSANAETILHA